MAAQSDEARATREVELAGRAESRMAIVIAFSIRHKYSGVMYDR